jgi:hypothetical protein
MRDQPLIVGRDADTHTARIVGGIAAAAAGRQKGQEQQDGGRAGPASSP